METFDDQASFLAFLRKFYHWEIIARSAHPDTLAELDVWKSILSRLRHR